MLQMFPTNQRHALDEWTTDSTRIIHIGLSQFSVVVELTAVFLLGQSVIQISGKYGKLTAFFSIQLLSTAFRIHNSLSFFFLPFLLSLTFSTQSL
jgi:hypothetical protein